MTEPSLHFQRFIRNFFSLAACFYLYSCTLTLESFAIVQIGKLNPSAIYFGVRQTSLFASNGGSLESKRPSIPFNAVTLVSRGMDAFRDGDVKKSVELFDAAEDASGGKLRPYLWQRGISYYYLDEFHKGSNQFRNDVSVNPLDVEEIVWDIACLNRLQTFTATSTLNNSNKEPLSLPPGKKDRRKIMGYVYSLFRNEGTEQDLALAGFGRNYGSNKIILSPSDEFYSLFYLGLYCDSKGEFTKAAQYMTEAITTEYASKSKDYMVAVAKVHNKVRGWF
jgi:tetratricopeptide (TPR) repeat protein